MSVNVWGPSDLQYQVDAMKSFIPNAAMVHAHSFGAASHSSRVSSPACTNSENPIVLLDDEVVKLSAVFFRPFRSAVTDLRKENSDDITSGPEFRNSDLRAKAVEKPGNFAVIYICELPEIQGKFDPKKAVALGLRPGPKYRELQLGNSVMSDSQNMMVQPSDVLGPSVPGPVVLLVDCCHLKELTSIQSLNSYHTDTSCKSPHGSRTVNCVIHLKSLSCCRHK